MCVYVFSQISHSIIPFILNLFILTYVACEAIWSPRERRFSASMVHGQHGIHNIFTLEKDDL